MAPRSLHGHCMVTAWSLHDHCMVTAWLLHGHYMVTAWWTQAVTWCGGKAITLTPACPGMHAACSPAGHQGRRRGHGGWGREGRGRRRGGRGWRRRRLWARLPQPSTEGGRNLGDGGWGRVRGRRGQEGLQSGTLRCAMHSVLCPHLIPTLWGPFQTVGDWDLSIIEWYAHRGMVNACDAIILAVMSCGVTSKPRQLKAISAAPTQRGVVQGA